MSKQFLNPRLQDADAIVKEYDGTMNQMLDYEEFQQLCLPSTNPNLRQMATTRRFSPYFRAQAPIPYEVLSLFTRLLDKEMSLQRARADSQRMLDLSADFVKVRVFEQITQGYHAIQMPDLITYLERNSFFPRREDVEAILRRCDHDGNRMISYSEFCEIAAIAQTNSARKQADQRDEAEYQPHNNNSKSLKQRKKVVP